MGDLFDLQNEITSRIAVALDLELIAAAAARPTDHPDALDYILGGRAARLKPNSRNIYAEAISTYERALALDPRSAEAQGLLAEALAGRVLDDMTDSAAADIKRAKRLSAQALAASPHSPLAHFAKATVLRAQSRFEEAIPEYEIVIAFNRNWPQAYAQLGQCKLYTGSIEETIPLVEQAIRLSPRDPRLGIWNLQIGRTHLLQSRIDKAIIWLERARNATPAHSGIRAWLASAYALKGEAQRAAAELTQARTLSGDDRYSSIARLDAAGYFPAPTIRALFETTYFAGLRAAGMPEE
jgi:adenylate cyclase